MRNETTFLVHRTHPGAVSMESPTDAYNPNPVLTWETDCSVHRL